MKKLLVGFAATVAALAAFAYEPGPRLVADYDRDGRISPADRERALSGDEFTIWINDDDDADGDGDTNNDLHDVPCGKDGEGNPHNKDCEDDQVNGRCDLLDFFPVLVNVREVTDWEYLTWKLCSDSVNVVFTGLKADNAGSFHTKDVDDNDGTSLHKASVAKLTEDGVALPSGFLDEAGEGVFVIEGRKQGSRCLTLRGYKYDEVVAEVTMNLDVENVESLYGWMNLRGSQPSTFQPSTFQPFNSSSDNRHFVLVHGYNTNHEEARGNAAEFYKKLWQSGSDAMFTAVEWRGDQSQIKFDLLGVNFTPNYYVNVENAFLAARPFADVCKKLPGEKILVGHSLGNMLVASAIKDYGLDYTKFVMLNAAVAREAFDASAYDEDMVDEDWLGEEVKSEGEGEGGKSLTNHLDRASRWYQNFADHKYDPYEYRRKLAWRGRFANLPRTVNYYSPTDNILVNPDPNEPDPNKVFRRDDPEISRNVRALLAAKLVNGRSIGSGGSKKTGFGFWSFSEKMKGTWLLDAVNDVLTNVLEVAQSDAYRREGGWGENDDYDDDPKKPFDPANTRFTPFLDGRMKTRGMLDILPAETERLRAQHLADAIPAESFAAGANPVATFENVDEEGFIGENPDWPLYEGEEVHTNLWNHSAFREVAFYHTSKFYDSLVAIGKPRVIIDTDLGSSMDDLFAIDLAARMHRAGKLDLMAVMMDRPDGHDPTGKGEFLVFADRYLASLGLGNLPIGKAMSPVGMDTPQYVFNPYWTLIYSNNVTGAGLLMPTNRMPEEIRSLTNAITLYRRLLNDAPDKSVVICSTGFLSNLRALMDSGEDYEGDGIWSTGLNLIAAKVKELRIMGGCFDYSTAPDGTDGAEYNFAGDPAAAKKVVEEWPTPVVLSPWEVGLQLDYKPKDVLGDFPAGTFDPVVRATYTYWPDPLREDDMNRLWDPTTVLPLTEGETLVPLSAMGGISVDETTGKTTFTPDPSSNRCYQVASNMNATAVMNRLRAIYRTGNPSLPDAVRCVKDAGVDYNGHDLTFKVPKFSLGAYGPDDVKLAFAVGDKTYAPDEVTFDPILEVFSVHFTVPAEDAVAGNIYSGVLTITLDNEKLGPNVVKTVPTQLVQGRQEQAEPMTDWFFETNLETPTNYVPATAMPERCLATVEATVAFAGQTFAVEYLSPTGAVQGAVRIVADGADGYKFQYYACVGKTNEDSFVRGWWDFNIGGEDAGEIKPVPDKEYVVRADAYYFEDARGEENTLVVSVAEVGSNRGMVKQFIGSIVNEKGGQGGTTRLHSVGFAGAGEISPLVGNYCTNVVNATLARIDGEGEFATVAEAVSAADGDPIRLLHAASWTPTADDLGRPVRFLNKSDLVLDLSGLPVHARAVWTDVDGNDGTLTLVAELPVGVCSWTWHASISNVLAQMKADGRYNGLQLALAPWLGIDNTGTYFGDQEGAEVWDFIKAKIASGELNVMSTMINFPKEDYTTLSSITNTQGYMYGVATNASDQAEQWASNLFYTAEAARLTAELGVKTLTTESGFICIDQDLMYDRLAEICATCRVQGVDFLVESGPQHALYMTNLLARLNAAGFDNVGVNFDPGDTALFGPEDPVESYKAMKPWIRQVHAKDCKANRAAWNEDCVWGDGYVSGLDFGGSRTFLNAVREDFPDGVNIVYERLSGDATLTVKRQREIARAVDRIIAQLAEPEGTAGNRWAVGAQGNAVLAHTNGTTLVVEGCGAMKDFGESAPWGTEIVAVELGPQVTTVGANAFAGCTDLKSLTLRGNPPALGAGNDLSGVTAIIIRADAAAKFNAAADWQAYADKFDVAEVGYDYANVKTLAPFLHEVRYTKDYVSAPDSAITENPSTLAAFACSAVRKGNFLGRNFDYVLNDVPTFVVRMDAAPGRLASVGVSQQWGLREDGVTNGQYTASYDLVPVMMLDGINECGVAVEDNVVHIGDCGELTGTNPGAPDLNISYVLRYVLDHATNAAHGVELIRSRNLVGDIGGLLYLHYMIADAKETYVVEVVTNTVVARHMDIMTNFNLNWDNGRGCAISDANSNGWTAVDYPAPWSNDVDVATIDGRYAPGSAGVERFLILRDHYDACEASMDGLTNLLRYVQYTKQAEPDVDPVWLSEIAAAERPLATLYAKYKRGDDDLMKALEKMSDETRYVFAHKEELRKKNTGEWQTVHNTTYDLANRMFRIAVQEDYAHTFDIYLTESVPVTPGEPIVCDTAEEATNVLRKAAFAPLPDVVEKLGKDPDALRTYCNMFALDIVPAAGGKWAVAALLLPPAWTNVVESAQEATLQLPVAGLAARDYGDPLKDVPLTNCVPGFYYSLYNGATVTNLRANVNPLDCNILCGPGTTVEIPELPHQAPKAGFFSIGVLEAPSVIPGETETSTNLSAIKRPERGGKSDIL